MAMFPTRGHINVATEALLYADAEVFPKLQGEEFVAKRNPRWNTAVRRAASGREIRSPQWEAPEYRYQLRHEFVRNLASKPELANLIGFFNLRQGRAGFFFYLDQTEYIVPGTSLGVGDGTTKDFQLMRYMGSGGAAALEPVHAIWGSHIVAVNGATKTLGTDYSILPWGIVRFVTAPANGAVLAWSGNALRVCRFDDDELELEELARSFWSSRGFEFITIKP